MNDRTDNTVNSTDGLVLDAACEPAWNAYNNMFHTKKRHFDFLQLLDNKKKKFNLSPTEEDNQKLATLLAEHDAQVKEFTHLSITLKNSHPAEHKRLFEYIAAVAKNDGDSDTQH